MAIFRFLSILRFISVNTVYHIEVNVGLYFFCVFIFEDRAALYAYVQCFLCSKDKFFEVTKFAVSRQSVNFYP